MMIEALRTDLAEVASLPFHAPPTAVNVNDVWAAVDKALGGKASGGKAQGGGAKAPAGVTDASGASAAAADKAAEIEAQGYERRDFVRVRLKRQYALHEIPEATNAGRHRLADGGDGGAGGRGSVIPPSDDCVWPTYGLLLFPAHASPQLPLEPAHEW